MMLIGGSRQPASITKWRQQGELHGWDLASGDSVDVGPN
jgi:hypothetical protein